MLLYTKSGTRDRNWLAAQVAVAACLASTLAPATAHATLPKNAVPPTVDWLLGGWVTKGAKCADLASVYLPGGKLGNVTSPNTIMVLGRYSLRGKVLTTTVPTDKYGDLVNTTWVGSIGQNLLVSDVPNNTNPNITVPPQRRCPKEAGPEPWFPKVRFKGMSAYRVVSK